MDLIAFKNQYRNILKNKLETRLKKLYESNGRLYNINDVKEQLSRLNDITNIKFGSMDFWGTSTSSDKLIVAIITSNIKLYRESTAFDTIKTILQNANSFGYTKFIIENDTLIDFYRETNPDKLIFVVDGVDIKIDETDIHKKYQDSLPERTASYYTPRYTRRGASMGHWNIGGVRVYD